MLKKQILAENFVNELVFKYFLQNPLFKIFIVPIFVLIYLSASCHSYIIEAVTALECYMISDIKSNYPGKLILLYLLFTVSHYLLTFFSDCLFAIYLQSTVVSSFKIHVKEYLVLHYEDFHSIGSGKIHTVIERRTRGIIDFIELLIMNAYFNSTILFVIYNRMYLTLGKELVFFNIGVLVAYLSFCYFTSFIIKRSREAANNDWNECSNRIYGILNNYDVIKSYNNDSLEICKLNEKGASVEMSYFYYDTVCNITRFAQVLLTILPNSIVIYMVLTGRGFLSLATFGQLALYHKQVMSLKSSMESFGKQLLRFTQTYTDVTDSYLVGKHLDNTNQGKEIQSFTDKIEFKQFSLYMKDRLLIKNFNFVINKGDKVAIVGKNGSGKSSLIKTLLRFYEYEGEVLIDGRDMRDITVVSQRNLISYIPQNPYIIEGTVLDNLKYSNKSITNKEIKNICLDYNSHVRNI